MAPYDTQLIEKQKIKFHEKQSKRRVNDPKFLIPLKHFSKGKALPHYKLRSLENEASQGQASFHASDVFVQFARVFWEAGSFRNIATLYSNLHGLTNV